jgi:hypothetical protein
VIHEQLGKPATPFFIGVRINTQGSHEVRSFTPTSEALNRPINSLMKS